MFIIPLSQPGADEVNFHFIAFVNVKGQLYELGKFLFSFVHSCVFDHNPI